jgi:hypothetical protein
MLSPLMVAMTLAAGFGLSCLGLIGGFFVAAGGEQARRGQ